ncbi:MAG: iron-sulfur cluster assembly accessory protein [Bacteroidia bacterium]|nr:iron-sulfur cluster assembly accessory protein [Bacteroidia bacterium]
MITLTEAAASQIRELSQADGRDGAGLRLSVDDGGCSGRQYVLAIGPALENDLTFTLNGASLFLDPACSSYVEGSEIDYEDGLTNAGFRIRNPRAKQTCGCGTSFEA